MGQTHLPTWSEVGARLVVGRWGRPVLRLAPHLPTRVWSEDGAQHIFCSWDEMVKQEGCQRIILAFVTLI